MTLINILEYISSKIPNKYVYQKSTCQRAKKYRKNCCLQTLWSIRKTTDSKGDVGTILETRTHCQVFIEANTMDSYSSISTPHLVCDIFVIHGECC